MKSYKFILFFIIILTSCINKPQNTTSENNESSNDSIQVIKEPYKNNPNVVEYEIPVFKGTKMRHGIQNRFNKILAKSSSLSMTDGLQR